MANRSIPLYDKRTFTENFDAALFFIKGHWRKLLPYMVLLTGIPMLLLNYLDFQLSISAGTSEFSLGKLVIMLLFNSFFLSSISSYLRLANSRQYDEITFKDFASGAFSKLGHGIWTSFIVSLIVFVYSMIGSFFINILAGGGLSLLAILVILIGFLYIITKVAFAIPATLLEDENGISAVGTSWNYTSEYFWPTLGLIVVFFTVIFSMLVSSIMFAYYIFTTITESGFGENVPDYYDSILVIVAIARVLIQFIAIVPFIALCFLYGSIKERWTGSQLSQRIEALKLDSADDTEEIYV